MKKVLITGGSDGLGKTIAKELSKDYKVYIAAVDEENRCFNQLCRALDTRRT